jgi:hypothetical protein
MIEPEAIFDEHDPASDLEEREEREHEKAVDRPVEDYSAALGRLLAWLLEGPTTAGIGLRTLVAVHKVRPDLIGGLSFEEISAMAGFGRSAAHNLSEDFERTFPGIHGRFDRSETARAAYRKGQAHRTRPKG